MVTYFGAKKIDDASEFFETSPGTIRFLFFKYFAIPSSKPVALNKYGGLYPC